MAQGRRGALRNSDTAHEPCLDERDYGTRVKMPIKSLNRSVPDGCREREREREMNAGEVVGPH